MAVVWGARLGRLIEVGVGAGMEDEVDGAVAEVVFAPDIGVSRRGLISTVVRCAEESLMIERRASWTPGAPLVRAVRAAWSNWALAASKR
jgi:hypothetical protein